MDKREKNRALSPAEVRRLARFEETAAQMEAEGFRRTDLTVGIVAANAAVFAAAIPLIVLCMWLYWLANDAIPGAALGLGGFVALLVALVVLTFVHECIHGATWAIFAPNHLKDVELGFMKEYLTPYCTCCAALERGPYIAGALMPLIVLGLIPLALGIAFGWPAVFWAGVLMTLAAGGDVMIVLRLLRYRTHAAEVVYMDHPTQAGLAVFER